MRYAYKCVAAPRRAKRGKGQKTAADAFAAAFETVMTEHAAAGWEYVRTDLAPMEARRGLFGGISETHQAVMVFRRPVSAASDAPLDLQPEARAPAEPEVVVPQLGAARLD